MLPPSLPVAVNRYKLQGPQGGGLLDPPTAVAAAVKAGSSAAGGPLHLQELAVVSEDEVPRPQRPVVALPDVPVDETALDEAPP